MIARFLLTLAGLLATASVVLSEQVPAPASAYIQEIALDPEQPEVLYVATTSSGLYRSNNGGAFWNEL
ncbi:MAG TPA: hypothetical protein VJ960_05750, partial [Oceanipulchritudo sp.]|nr:hypothetical protein [Oceanipulchritudo sp.]